MTSKKETRMQKRDERIDPNWRLSLFYSGLERRRGQQQGFSLIEIIIATVILVILASGIFSTFSYTQRVSSRSNEQAIAALIVEKKMNQWKKIGSIAIEDSMNGLSTIDLSETTTAADGLVGTLATRITDASGGLNLREKEIRITFNWTNALGVAQSESIATYLYQE